MPKKFNGENHKAVVAKNRQLVAKETEEKRKQAEIEDALWKEDDKKILKKQQRRESSEKKRQQTLDKKAEAKLLLQQELDSLKTPKIVFKVTKAQIDAMKVPFEKKLISPKLEENLNRKDVGGEEARTVTEAIAILNIKDSDVDKHPEKRRKSAYVMFEEKRLQELKNSNPQLKFSQLKKIIFKEWQKSPDNPINKFGSM